MDAETIEKIALAFIALLGTVCGLYFAYLNNKLKK